MMQTNAMARQALKDYEQHQDSPCLGSSQLLAPPNTDGLATLAKWKKVELVAALRDCLKQLNYGKPQEETDSGSFECLFPHVDLLFAVFPGMFSALKLDKEGEIVSRCGPGLRFGRVSSKACIQSQNTLGDYCGGL